MIQINARRAFTTLLLCSIACLVIAPADAQGLIAKRQKVEVTRDLDYAGTDNPRQKLDLYLPKQRATDKPLPVVVFVHGGGWRAGNKRIGGPRLIDIVADGKFAGVSVGYRLTDEARWPDQLHDCKAAIRWIRANAKQHGLDADKIAVWGTSAGGHLVSCLGTMNEESQEGTIGDSTSESSRVTCVINFFGPSNFLTMGREKSRIDHDAADSPESNLIGGALGRVKEKAKSASPALHISKDDAPHLIVHGTADPLVPFAQSTAFHKALGEAEVSSVLITMDGAGHGFASPKLNERIGEFLGKHLLGEDIELEDETFESVRGNFRRRPE